MKVKIGVKIRGKRCPEKMFKNVETYVFSKLSEDLWDMFWHSASCLRYGGIKSLCKIGFFMCLNARNLFSDVMTG